MHAGLTFVGAIIVLLFDAIQRRPLTWIAFGLAALFAVVMFAAAAPGHRRRGQAVTNCPQLERFADRVGAMLRSPCFWAHPVQVYWTRAGVLRAWICRSLPVMVTPTAGRAG